MVHSCIPHYKEETMPHYTQETMPYTVGEVVDSILWGLIFIHTFLN
jgi:hypothetical protein